MPRGRLRTLIVAFALALAAAAALAVVLKTRQAGASDTTGASCSSRLLHDWSDGQIHGSYPIRCYRRTLHTLPVDLQMYSSAPDDIAQALSRELAGVGD